MLKKAKAEANAGKKRESAADDGKDFAQVVLESSRQIWLAGLGAFSRARGEGMKVFEALVEQGQGLEARTKRAASETAAAAAGAAAQKAKEMQAMAGGTWDKLEQVFEDRVARALAKLGVNTQNDVSRLAERVEALAEAVNELIKAGGGAVRATTLAAGGKKRAAKRASRADKATAASEATGAPQAKRKTRASRKRATGSDT